MKAMDILLASNNSHKLQEFVRLFPGHRILSPSAMEIDFDFEENGRSFLENAFGKAMALFSRARIPVISDDSGLCVHALGGEPGVYSSRYGAEGGGPLDTPRRNELLLSRLKGISDRRACFVCCLVLVLDENRFFVAQETVEGVIADAPSGVNGFGYDPLFLLPEKGATMAELSDEEKDSLSHRGRAARRVLSLLGGLEV
jgi:XTP/dITP diphosphohydrolase